MRLTKIDVAEAHLISAVRMHFQNGHPASVYLLAASAREILTTLGGKTGVRTMLHELAESKGIALKDLISLVHKHARFMKHANNDPAGILDDLDEKDLEMLLYIACHDFHRIAKGQPVELQVYEVWSLTRHWIKVPDAPLKIQPLLRQLRKRFPGLATASNREARALGWSELQKALLNPAFRMDIERQVKVLQSGSASL